MTRDLIFMYELMTPQLVQIKQRKSFNRH